MINQKDLKRRIEENKVLTMLERMQVIKALDNYETVKTNFDSACMSYTRLKLEHQNLIDGLNAAKNEIRARSGMYSQMGAIGRGVELATALEIIEKYTGGLDGIHEQCTENQDD